MLRYSAAAFAILLAAVFLHAGGALRPLDNRLAEARFGLVTRVPTGSVVLVDIDAKSLAEIGTWPWPRTVHENIVDALMAAEAAEIAFDIDFSATSNPAADSAFAAALQRAGGAVILAVFNQRLDGDGGSGEVHANVPIAAFMQHAWAATVNVRSDPDGFIRGFSLGEPVDGVPTPSMPAVLGGYVGPIEGEFLIDYGIDAHQIERISAIDLIRGAVDPARIAGRKAIVGASAVELRDFFQVPSFGVISGPTIQALATESLLQGRALKTLNAAWPVAGLLLLGVAAVLSRRAKLVHGLGALACCVVAAEAAAVFIQAQWPLVAQTAMLHAGAAGLAMLALAREIGFRRILLAISSTEARNTRKILAQVVSDNFAGVIVADEAGVIQAASRSAEAMLRPGQGDLVGTGAGEALPPVLSAALTNAARQLKEGAWEDKGPQELVFTRPGQEPRILEYVVRPSRLSGGVSKMGTALPDRFVATVTFMDVTQKRKADARLAYLARFDTLTGLPNRNQFCEALEARLKGENGEAFSGAVVFFDLDRFKNVNDTLGHQYGDLLLKVVAERAQALIGPDDLASRFGGDEYAIIHAGSDRPEGAMGLAERLIEKLGEPYQIEGHRLIIGVSVGIAFAEAGTVDPMQLMKNADTALYRAKGSGGNAYRVYDRDMDSRLQARQALEIDLWDAFERNQFEVHYQPQVELTSEEVIGVEALVRWRHPVRGFVSPAEFIPVAEAVGLIEPLGTFVLREACRAAANWPKAIKVAVNVSPVQFTRGDLLSTVRTALGESGLPATRLDLEITESLFINENQVIETTMAALRDLGASFSIDDFGTGYSSLSYIRKFPVQKIKIDRSFVTGLPFDKESVAIVRAITALAHSLEIRVNAEGVETAEHVASLRLLGCGEGQGYLFGKPQPAEAIAELLLREPVARRLSA